MSSNMMFLCSGKTSMNAAIRCRVRMILRHTSECSRRHFSMTRSQNNHAFSHPQQQHLRTLTKKTTTRGKHQQPQNSSLLWQETARPPTIATLSVTAGSALWDTLLPNAIAATWTRQTTSCEAVARCDQHAMVSYHPTVPAKIQKSSSSSSSSWLGRACRMVLRFIKLTFTLAPVVAFYPILLWTNQTMKGEDAHDVVLASFDETRPPPGKLLSWYLNLCLTCVEYSGAAVIKLMQWAGSRPDMFGYDFCSVFARLQDDTTPHAWKHTQRAMQLAYGQDWQSHIQLHEIIGSGCIGQVYRGQVLLPPNGNNNNNAKMIIATSAQQQEQQHPSQQVAVKVLHPNVEQDIDADLDLMRFAVRAIQWFPFAKGLKWLDLEGFVEEFAVLLKEQLDLRNEAANLQRFHQNFDTTSSMKSSNNKVNVIFPHLVHGFAPSRDVLVETFCDGIPVLEFARQHKEDRAMLSRMCRTGISAVCKMIFLDNFMHGDLHPGNVFISRDGKNFILFDVGIVAEYTDEDHAAIVSILAEFIRKNGRKAGILMIDDSNRRLQKESNDKEMQQHALQVETFLTKIEYLTIQASGKDYLMQKLGEYISYICQAAATHHVKLNPSFISAALAVKVEEGIALALDPSVEIWRVATPIIIESETRRRFGNSLRGGKKKKETTTRGGDMQDSGDVDNGNKDSSYLEAALRLLRGEK